MASPTTPLRRTLRLLVLTALAASFLVAAGSTDASAAPGQSQEEMEHEFLQLLNLKRVDLGLPPMVRDSSLRSSARSWSARMAKDQRLYHDPDLRGACQRASSSWQSCAENIGYRTFSEGDVLAMHNALVASSGHYRNIKGESNRVGIGVVVSGGRLWVTFKFMLGPAIDGETGLHPLDTPGTLPLAGDFNGDHRGEVILYGPGGSPDGRLTMDATTASNGRTVMRDATISGIYRPLVGEFTGDGLDDIVWYAPGAAKDYLWAGRSDGGFDSSPRTINGTTYDPLVGDFDGNGVDDIVWYAPGKAKDYIWSFRAGGSYTSRPTQINGRYKTIVSDFDGNRVDDVLWYAPGTTADFRWSFERGGTHRSTRATANGVYEPFAGDFNGDGYDDIVWYAPGGARDFLWWGRESGYGDASINISGSYIPSVADFDGDGAEDVLWVAPQRIGGESYWFFDGTSPRSVPLQLAS
ncbi:FG-GAP-like repeat-containing protein [Actinospongicola halichondriae]|uniref:FG-GAP-like repeat-containing protein n=1 Tax=Actinospongicola halichondriae TaxID=3236844 RepID=UPI003D544BF8